MLRWIFGTTAFFFRKQLTFAMKTIIEKEGTVKVQKVGQREGKRCLETVYWINAQTYTGMKLEIEPVSPTEEGPRQLNLVSVTVSVFDPNKLTCADLLASAQYSGTLTNPGGLGIIRVQVLGAHAIGRALIA